MRKDRRGLNPASKPSGDGCVECLASPKGWWLHLRRCAECGHIGCCDSSPSQHASKHAAAAGHPIIASFEPGEDWFFDYEKQGMIKGVELLPPHSHPENQVSSRFRLDRYVSQPFSHSTGISSPNQWHESTSIGCGNARAEQ